MNDVVELEGPRRVQLDHHVITTYESRQLLGRLTEPHSYAAKIGALRPAAIPVRDTLNLG